MTVPDLPLHGSLPDGSQMVGGSAFRITLGRSALETGGTLKNTLIHEIGEIQWAEGNVGQTFTTTDALLDAAHVEGGLPAEATGVTSTAHLPAQASLPLIGGNVSISTEGTAGGQSAPFVRMARPGILHRHPSNALPYAVDYAGYLFR